jgi:hypothetical protein
MKPTTTPGKDKGRARAEIMTPLPLKSCLAKKIPERLPKKRAATVTPKDNMAVSLRLPKYLGFPKTSR